jgi:hypothetical protein
MPPLKESSFVRIAEDIRTVARALILNTILRKPLCLLIVVKQAVWPS